MTKWAYLNQRILKEQDAEISVLDRGFLYGDGVFETILAINGNPFRLEQHFQRLRQGADLLHLCLPLTIDELREAIGLLLYRNCSPEGILRLTLTRGVGPRGFSPRGADHPTVAITLHELPAPTPFPLSWKLAAASLRLPTDLPLAQAKTCNKLIQVLARAEAEAAGADEAILCNTDGYAVEGSSSNLFWLEGETICTPPLHTTGILPGVTREALLECARAANLSVREARITLQDLARADGVFLTLTTLGLVQASELNGISLKRCPDIVENLFMRYWNCVERETKIPGSPPAC